MKSSPSWNQVAAFRLTRHHLVNRSRGSLVSVCGEVCGIQAQIMSAARIALWARVRDLKTSDIRSALYEKRELVKTSSMRQTLHLLPASDYAIYIAALRKSRIEAVQRVMSRFGVTQKDTERLNDLILAVLDGRQLPQREINELIRPRVSKRVRAWMENVWSVLRLAQAEGLICYGPEMGTQVTYVRVDQWLAKQPTVDESEAKRILLRRYLAAYGPATSRDFSHWSGISIKETTPVWESLAAELKEVTIEDQKTWIHSEDHDALFEAEKRDKPVRLLPGFDPFLLAHAGKDHLVEREHYKRVYRNQGWITPVVLWNGRVIGTWSTSRRGKELSVEFEPFEKQSKTVHSKVSQEIAGLESFLNRQKPDQPDSNADLMQ